MDEQSLILARKLVKEGGEASPDTIAQAKAKIARNIEAEHKQALRTFYNQYGELSVFLYCVLSLFLALLVIGLVGGIITALSTVAPPVMAILVLSPQTLVTIFAYSFASLVGVFGLSFLLKRPFLLRSDRRAQALYQQVLEERIEHVINQAATSKLKGDQDDLKECRERVLRLQAQLNEECETGIFAKLSAAVRKNLRSRRGRYALYDPEYFDTRLQNVLSARYAKARQLLLGGAGINRIARHLGPYEKLGFIGPGQPNYKQLSKTVTALHRELYALDKAILSASHAPDPSVLEKRKVCAEFLVEQEGLRRQLWYESIPVIGGAVGWIRKGMLKLGMWPNNLSEEHGILQMRERFLEKSCLHLQSQQAARKWYDHTISWATEEKYLWSMPGRRSLLGFSSQRGRQMTWEEYQTARKAFMAFLQDNNTAYNHFIHDLQKLVGEGSDAQAAMHEYTKKQLLRWLRMLSADDSQGSGGNQTWHEEYAFVYKMCPGKNQDEKEKLLREKLAGIEDSSFWHRFLTGIGWRSKDAIARAQRDRESKEDAIMAKRIHKASRSIASIAIQEEHLEDAERWRLRKLLGKPMQDAEKLDYEAFGLYRPEEIEKIAEDFNNTSYFSYLYQVFYTLSATKLHKTLDVYECKLSCQMAAYGELDDEHKRLLLAMDTVREKLKKDESVDIFRDMIYPFTLLQGLFAAMASSVVEPLFGGVVLTMVSTAGLVNNMRTKGRRDIATLGFVTTLLMGIGIIAIQSVLLAGIAVSGAAVAVGVLAAVGGTLSFLTWVVRGAKRSIDSEKNINPRISMATRKCLAMAIELDDALENDVGLKKWLFDESVSQEEAKRRFKQANIAPHKRDWLWKKRDQFLDAKAYIRLLCKQQTNLIRTIKNGVNRDVELGIISERCEKISRAYHNQVLSKEAAESMLQPLLHAKTVQENHTNRNYLYIWVSVPAVTMGFIALSSIIFPIAPLLLATVLVGVQITAIGVFSLVHLHQYAIGAKGIFYQVEPSAKDYLAQKEKKMLTISQEDYDMVKTKNQVLAERYKKSVYGLMRQGFQEEKNESQQEIEMVDMSRTRNHSQVRSNESAANKSMPEGGPEGHKDSPATYKRKGSR